MSDYAPPPPKKKGMERRNPLFDFQKTSPTLLEPSTCLEGAINKAAAWWTQSTGGTSSVAHVCLVVFFLFFFLLHAVTHTELRPRGAGGRQEAWSTCQMWQAGHAPKTTATMRPSVDTSEGDGREKKTSVVLHRRKQIAVRVSPVVFPVPAAGSCCCLDLLAGEGGVNTRPWMLPLLR